MEAFGPPGSPGRIWRFAGAPKIVIFLIDFLYKWKLLGLQAAQVGFGDLGRAPKLIVFLIDFLYKFMLLGLRKPW